MKLRAIFLLILLLAAPVWAMSNEQIRTNMDAIILLAEEVKAGLGSATTTTTLSTSTTVPPTLAPDAMIEIPTNRWITCKCPGPPSSGYLHAGQIEKLVRIAQALDVQLVIVHGNPLTGAEGAHAGNAVDILYLSTPELNARLVLALVNAFPNIARSTLSNPTKAQIISAAVQESDEPIYHHDTHMHVELGDPRARILMSSDRRDTTIAAGRRL